MVRYFENSINDYNHLGVDLKEQTITIGFIKDDKGENQEPFPFKLNRHNLKLIFEIVTLESKLIPAYPEAKWNRG